MMLIGLLRAASSGWPEQSLLSVGRLLTTDAGLNVALIS